VRGSRRGRRARRLIEVVEDRSILDLDRDEPPRANERLAQRLSVRGRGLTTAFGPSARAERASAAIVDAATSG
jgi:hypothetical protein